ncbi:MAG: arginase family protein [Bacillota bacterium]
MNKIYYKLRSGLTINYNPSEENYSIWDSKEGWELVVNKKLILFMNAYSLATTKETVFHLLRDQFQVDEKTSAEVHEYLYEQNIISEYIPLETNVGTGKGGIFNTPVMSIDQCLEGDWCDLVFIGMPYDLNVTHKPGTRLAPGYLRRVSGSLFQYDGTHLKGAYDPIEDQQKLEGIRMADCGDIHSVVFSKNGKEFDALEELIGRVIRKGIFPVTIGGDHSISLPCIKGVAANHEKIGVIQLDAHSDFGMNSFDDWRDSVHHGNFIDAVLPVENVEHVIQIGIRQLTQEKVSHPKIIQYPGKSVFNHIEELKTILRKDIRYYLTIDVDVLDPSIMPATGTPLPNGFSYIELMNIIELITEHVNLSGLDVVELLPFLERDIEGVMVSEIIFSVISKVMNRKDQYEHHIKNSNVSTY